MAEAYDRSEHVLVERFWGRHRDPLIADQVRLVLETASPGVSRVLLKAPPAASQTCRVTTTS
ncbi:MAG: hypothetical protein Q7W02_28165 [Candidatus Rokubacteria bacterium]|nr:hypothetical protein [Candidatus Rokubacteria bacterium]